jgi:HSP20 family protein
MGIVKYKNNPVDDLFFDIFKPRQYADIMYDLFENDKEYLINLALPGFDKKNITVELKNKTLIVSAEKDENNSMECLRKTIPSGRVEKRFTVPENIDEKIEASFDSGILTITLIKSNNNRLIKIN